MMMSGKHSKLTDANGAHFGLLFKDGGNEGLSSCLSLFIRFDSDDDDDDAPPGQDKDNVIFPVVAKIYRECARGVKLMLRIRSWRL